MNGAAASPAPGGADSRLAGAMLEWLQDIAPFGIFTTDAQYRIRSWNEWLASYSGLSGAKVIGRSLPELYPELAERRLLPHYERALAGQVSMLSTALHRYLLPFPVPHPQHGAECMLQTARIAPLRLGPDEFGTVTIIEDVTQRETQALLLLRQQENDRLLSGALGTLLQSARPEEDLPEIFFRIAPILGLDLYFAYLLDAPGNRLTLLTAGGVAAKQRESLSSFAVPPEDRARSAQLTAPLRASAAAHQAALDALGARARCVFPLVIGERPIGLVSFASYQREQISEQDFGVLSRIARYAGIALDRALREREIVAASRAKDDFLAALSHELRTPLNPVLLLASDALSNVEYPASAREAFRVIEKNALLEARLIDDLLDLTRIEHGKISLDRQPVDIHSVLQDALVTVRADAHERRIAVELDLQADHPRVLGDAGRLQQVFWNVLKNAVKFSPVGGRIQISTRTGPEAGEVTVFVTDHGIGIELHEMERIFSAFSQGDHAERARGHRFGGLGLGLAISRKLVELHSGRIHVVSPGKDQGATFTIELPLLARSPERDAAPAALSEPLPAGAAAPSARILVVEDHEPTREPLTRLLKRRGFQVVAVSSSTEALGEAARSSFDLVLSDIGLPDGDGYALMRALRERYGMKGIALTGYGMTEDISRSSAAGFVAHLTKPIQVSVLDRALAAALPAAGGAGPG
ncbi:MAG TPA: ATP-binding protein [Opitutaceae bacterium]|jgi:PAS domain S-box-containing protein|nr:ATP-binding protein [Opitutaceae bacterium]